MVAIGERTGGDRDAARDVSDLAAQPVHHDPHGVRRSTRSTKRRTANQSATTATTTPATTTIGSSSQSSAAPATPATVRATSVPVLADPLMPSPPLWR